MFDPNDTVRHADQLREQAAALIRTTQFTPDGVDHTGVGQLLMRASAIETLAWQSVFERQDTASTPAGATAS